MVRRTDTPATARATNTVRELPVRAATPAHPVGRVGIRLQATYLQGRADGQLWTARSLAEAAGCGRSSAATFLQRHRYPGLERAA
jgi:hypothetical protein